jgi:tetratricopeptide (TPR) repeat protein
MAAETTDLPDFDAWWDYEQPAATEARFRALLPRAAQSGDPAYHVELLTQIARTEGLQGRFAAAEQTLDGAAALPGAAHPRPRIRLLLERGRVHNSAGRLAAARPLFLAAWEAARAAGEDFHAIDAAHMLGIVDPPEAQLAWTQTALALAEQSADPRARRWRGSLYNNLGWTYHDLGRYEEALAIFRQGLAWREAQGQPAEARIARWCIGRVLRSLGRYAEAQAIQEGVLAEVERVGAPVDHACEELGECALAQGRPAAARVYFARAYAALAQDAWRVEHEPARLQRLQARAVGGSGA